MLILFSYSTSWVNGSTGLINVCVGHAGAYKLGISQFCDLRMGWRYSCVRRSCPTPLLSRGFEKQNPVWFGCGSLPSKLTHWAPLGTLLSHSDVALLVKKIITSIYFVYVCTHVPVCTCACSSMYVLGRRQLGNWLFPPLVLGPLGLNSAHQGLLLPEPSCWPSLPRTFSLYAWDI